MSVAIYNVEEGPIIDVMRYTSIAISQTEKVVVLILKVYQMKQFININMIASNTAAYNSFKNFEI